MLRRAELGGFGGITLTSVGADYQEVGSTVRRSAKMNVYTTENVSNEININKYTKFGIYEEI